jgi:hypothetical protein
MQPGDGGSVFAPSRERDRLGISRLRRDSSDLHEQIESVRQAAAEMIAGVASVRADVGAIMQRWVDLNRELSMIQAKLEELERRFPRP